MSEEDADMVLPPVSIPEVSNFFVEGQRASEENRIIMLLISQTYCPYCELIKEEIIYPMIRGKDHANRLLIRELHTDKSAHIRNFDGTVLSARSFAKQHKASLTPTLLFLDGRGNELTERLVGINTPEMYFYYVDEAIKKALLAKKG